jgi:phospholipid N-methyltransferase
MPDLDTSMHLDTLKRSRLDMLKRSRPVRVLSAVGRELRTSPLYGLEWGDPEVVPPLGYIRDHYPLPYVKPGQTGLEIGPGGGRWTRYMLGFDRLYAVDYHAEVLKETGRYFSKPNVVMIANNGTDFPGIDAQSVDFAFSFGVFVHLEPHLITGYLDNLHGILKPEANVVIQYSDMTKVMAQQHPGFVYNTPEIMRSMVTEAGYRILEEDLTSLWHSDIVRFTTA